jgi:hypothetical protein
MLVLKTFPKTMTTPVAVRAKKQCQDVWQKRSSTACQELKIDPNIGSQAKPTDVVQISNTPLANRLVGGTKMECCDTIRVGAIFGSEFEDGMVVYQQLKLGIVDQYVRTDPTREPR